MENRRLIITFATIFSLLFAVVYYFLFTFTLTSTTTEKRVLYMNQVGLYKKADSVNKMKETMKDAGFTGYTLKQGDLNAVVVSVSTNEKSVKKDQAKLKELKYSYIMKKVSVDDPNIVALIDQKAYEKALDRIGE